MNVNYLSAGNRFIMSALKKMTAPNFIVIGATKAGTTSLYNYLKQHAQIYLTPVKETNFFALCGKKADFKGPGDDKKINRTSITDIAAYQNQFSGLSGEPAIGEISPLYLYFPGTAERIQQAVPDARLIAILRNPVDRAYSNYLHLRRDGRETFEDFGQALQEEPKRIEAGWGPIWHYQALGFYHEQLQRYYRIFDQRQIHVYLFERFVREPLSVLQEIFRVLGVDDSFKPDLGLQYNVSGIPKNQKLYRILADENPVKNLAKSILPEGMRKKTQILLNRIRNRNLLKPKLSAECRKRLEDLYRTDILKTQDLIGQDVSQWLTD